MSDKAAFIGNFIIRGKFECLTGLHIGGSKEKLEIGGVDSPVVRDPRTRYPYVPGSSLKGKLRSLLEYGTGNVDPEGEVSTAVEIVRLFGIGVDEKNKESKNFIAALDKIGPSRLVVRDCHPDKHTTTWWEKLDSDLQYTEMKSENGINRITSAANPRFIERVAAGSRFEFEMVYSVFKIKDDKSYLKDTQDDLDNLRMALLMLEHNFIGKSGSRGYGRIKFYFDNPVWIAQNDYKQNDNAQIKAAAKPLPVETDGLHPVSSLQLTIAGLAHTETN
jgi:CRISPR-associated protein Csm3